MLMDLAMLETLMRIRKRLLLFTDTYQSPNKMIIVFSMMITTQITERQGVHSNVLLAMYQITSKTQL